MNCRKALIFGVSGQDGSYLAKLLLEKGYQVVGTSRDAQVGQFLNLAKLGILDKINLVSMTITDYRSVLNVIHDTEPDEIYNLAGQSSVGFSFDQPVDTLESISVGTLNLLEAVRFLNKKIKIYNAGSSECFGEVDGYADETTPFRPRSPYAVAKAAAFWEVSNYREAYGLYACSGILFNHESPLRQERFVTQKIIKAALRIANGSLERLSLGNLKIMRDWGWAPEYVNAMWLMLQQDISRDFVIATGKTNSLEDFVDMSFKSVGLNYLNHIDIDEKLFRPTDLLVSRANPLEAYKKLGWKAEVSMPEVVDKMITAVYSESNNEEN